MTVAEVAEKFGLEFVQTCSANNIHIAKEGKAACNSRFRVFKISIEYATGSWIGCTKCYKQLEKLGLTVSQYEVKE